MTATPSLSSNALGRELLESMWIEVAIITLVIAARLYTRFFLVRKVCWDDYLMITAFLVDLVATILSQLAIKAGFGQHAENLDPQLVIQVIKWTFLGQVFGILASAFARMAFIVTLINLLSPTQRTQLWLLRIFFAVQVCINFMTALYIPLQCRPTYGLWDHTVSAECLPPSVQEHIGFSQGSVNSFSDLALAVFPATVIWKLNMKRSMKASLCATMGLGVFAFATSVIKTVNLREIDANPNDLTYNMFGIQFWFCIENATLIVSATIPTLRPLFTRRKASETKSYDLSGRHSFQRWNGTWNNIEAPVRLNSTSGCSDRVELTGVKREDFVTGTDTECVAVAEGGSRRPRELLEGPPGSGIMKTVSTDVTY